MTAHNHKKKYLTREQVNYLQGLVKMRGHDSLTLAAATGFSRPTIIAHLNGGRNHPLPRWAIATVLGEPVHRLFPPPGEEHKPPDLEK